MNVAVHTNASVHRCRDDITGASAICLTTHAAAAASSSAVSAPSAVKRLAARAGGSHADIGRICLGDGALDAMSWGDARIAAVIDWAGEVPDAPGLDEDSRGERDRLRGWSRARVDGMGSRSGTSPGRRS